MVACAAVSQSQVLLAVPMTGCIQSVEQLKEKLLSAVENEQYTDALEAIANLEKAHITREVLEGTRIGAAVNEVRKKIADRWPDVSKKCRNLIKAWQRLVEVNRPPSTASSANGTPNLVSPSLAKLGRKVTPGTPVNRRVTSTGLTNGDQIFQGRGLTVSPANGSYAPKELLSPNGSMHKSQSVGMDLLAKGEEAKNGKRKSEENVSTALKRTKTVGSGLSGAVATPGQSVNAARMAVQSTSELIAQLSQNLPQHLAIDSTLRQHEEKVKREQQDEELAISLHGTMASTVQPPERKKRKYERKQRPETENVVSPPVVEERRGGLILRLPRISMARDESIKKEERPETPQSSQIPSSDSQPSTPPEPEVEEKPKKKINWLDMIPSLEEMEKRAEEERNRPKLPKGDPMALRFIPLGNGEVIRALPYLENTSGVPDFIKYKYPDPARFYAETSRFHRNRNQNV